MTVEDAAWKTEHSAWDPRTSHSRHFVRTASCVAGFVSCDTLEFPCTGVSVRDLPHPGSWNAVSSPCRISVLPRWLGGQEPSCQCRSCRFDPWIRKIPWRTWQPPPAFSPGESYGQRSLAGCSLWGGKESDTTEHACMFYFSRRYYSEKAQEPSFSTGACAKAKTSKVEN